MYRESEIVLFFTSQSLCEMNIVNVDFYFTLLSVVNCRGYWVLSSSFFSLIQCHLLHSTWCHLHIYGNCFVRMGSTKNLSFRVDNSGGDISPQVDNSFPFFHWTSDTGTTSILLYFIHLALAIFKFLFSLWHFWCRW